MGSSWFQLKGRKKTRFKDVRLTVCSSARSLCNSFVPIHSNLNIRSWPKEHLTKSLESLKISNVESTSTTNFIFSYEFVKINICVYRSAIEGSFRQWQAKEARWFLISKSLMSLSLSMTPSVLSVFYVFEENLWVSSVRKYFSKFSLFTIAIKATEEYFEI